MPALEAETLSTGGNAPCELRELPVGVLQLRVLRNSATKREECRLEARADGKPASEPERPFDRAVPQEPLLCDHAEDVRAVALLLEHLEDEEGGQDALLAGARPPPAKAAPRGVLPTRPRRRRKAVPIAGLRPGSRSRGREE